LKIKRYQIHIFCIYTLTIYFNLFFVWPPLNQMSGSVLVAETNEG